MNLSPRPEHGSCRGEHDGWTGRALTSPAILHKERFSSLFGTCPHGLSAVGPRGMGLMPLLDLHQFVCAIAGTELLGMLDAQLPVARGVDGMQVIRLSFGGFV